MEVPKIILNLWKKLFKDNEIFVTWLSFGGSVWLYTIDGEIVT